MIMKIPVIDDRLYLAASFVREGGTVADIGTDHAYIPIYLINTDRVLHAIASDVNEGPLKRAEENARRYGAEGDITFALADGLSGLPLEEKGVIDIVICGMGGELIAKIIDGSDYVKKEGVRLILQPMTKPEALRKYLSEKGFREIDGGIAVVDKVYQCIVCEYTGESYALTEGELYVGQTEGIRNSENFPLIAEKYISAAKKRLMGPEKNEAEALIRELLQMIEKGRM